MAVPTIRDYGDRALLIECDGIDEVLAFAAAVRAGATEGAISGVVDVVPAARTVLVSLADPRLQQPVRALLGAVEVTPSPPPTGGTADVVIDVRYDGPDLEDVAAQLRMAVDEVVEAHTGTPWRVGFSGFAPGFAYLVGGDARLRVPRRAEPRTRVPAGAVALAGEFSGIYPRESPGGWQLIGRTDAVLWDLDRAAPALLRPGMWVRFQATASGAR